MGVKKPARKPVFLSNKNYLAGATAAPTDAAAASTADAAAPTEAAAASVAAATGAAAGAATEAAASTAAAGAEATASSFLPQAAKAIAIRETSRIDFFMLLLSNK